MPQSYAALCVHAVFSTKNHLPQIELASQRRLFEYIGGLCKARKSSLLAAGGTVDHVHLLISLSREYSAAKLLGEIKADSSGWIHKTFPERHDFDWQDGYGVFSVSHSNLESVKGYLARQAEHHHKRSFKEEFRELLLRHHVAFDERYIWK